MNNEENEVIDLVEILYAIRQHLLEVILATVVAAIIGFAASKFLMTPQYSSSAMMIVNTRQDVTSNVTSDQINSATKLVATYSIIIKSDTVLQQVCDEILAVSPDIIKEAVEAGSVKVISKASLNLNPISPNIKKNTALGAMVGLALALGIIVLQVLLDNKINTEEDVTKYLDMTVLGVIPQYDQGGKME